MNPLRGVLVLLALLAPAAEAQFTARADAALGSGGPTPAQRGLWTAGARLGWTGPLFRLNLEGEYREFDARGAGSYGHLNASWFVAVAGGISGELTGEATGITGPGYRAGLALAGGRLHISAGPRGAWFGSQAGRDGTGTVIRWEGAAWQRFGSLTVQVQGSQTSSGSLVQRAGTAPDTLTPRPDTLTREQHRVHTDVGTWVSWTPGDLELAGALGRRFGIVEPGSDLAIPPRDGGLASQRSTTRAATWWMLEARWWFSPTVALMGVAGYQPPDGSLRVPGGRFAKLGLSAALPRARRGRPALPSMGAPRVPAAALAITRLPDDSVQLTIPAPDARMVEVMGDFTDWVAVPLARSAGGQWHLRRWLLPGTYALNVRYDGGPWAPPPGVPVVLDEFGERTGVVVVR